MRSATRTTPRSNMLIAALDGKTCQRLQAALEPVSLVLGEVLYEPGEPIRHVYFPGDGLISLLAVGEGNLVLEVALVGREGFFGIPLVLGSRISSVRALVQGAGTAMRMSAARFLRELKSNPALQRELNRYANTLMAQIAQNAACNRFHVVEARLARWLLMTFDRLQKKEFCMTQEFLASMLGVRRVGVSAAASALRHRKLIEYRRGSITILDRKGLAGAACKCYQANRKREKTR